MKKRQINTKLGRKAGTTVALLAAAAFLTVGGIAVTNSNKRANDETELLDLNEEKDIAQNNENSFEENSTNSVDVAEAEVDEHFGMDNVMDATDEYIPDENMTYKSARDEHQQIIDSNEESDEAISEETQSEEQEDTTQLTEETGEGEVSEVEETAEASSMAVANSLNFSEDSALLWPVDGNVILNYNMDSTVYFATLEQYKYNPAIIIQGEVGSKVYAAADGVIENIYEDVETGTTVIVNLGNGYKATYGQLSNIAVNIGTVVNKSDIIGEVNEPTKYYNIEGSNLYFKLEKEEQAVDPLNYLE